MESFTKMVNNQKLSTILTKSSILSVAAVLDMPIMKTDYDFAPYYGKMISSYLCSDKKKLKLPRLSVMIESNTKPLPAKV